MLFRSDHLDASDRIQSAVRCPSCGAVLDAETGRCLKCGARGWRVGRISLALGLVIVLAGGAAGWFYFQKAKAKKTVPSQSVSPVSKRPKSLSDLKVGDIVLEQTPGSKLRYAVGTVQNDSEHQRFGVKIVLDLFDRNETKVATATDYVQVLEPHGSWRFRALVLDLKAASARLARISEE